MNMHEIRKQRSVQHVTSVKIDQPLTVYRVAPLGQRARDAFGHAGVYVFTRRDDACEYQDIAGGRIFVATLAPHLQGLVDDFSIELMHRMTPEQLTFGVYGNAGDSDLYPAGTQLYVCDPGLLSDFSRLGRRAKPSLQ